jgi:glycosyltransferase involved in cell wall biosynthesis
MQKKLVYIGHISKEHGLHDIFETLAETDFELDIIGSGNFENELKKIASEKKLEHKINFLGKKNHQEIFKYLKTFSGFGIAPYNSASDWTRYCDPVKVKEYLACFVPVIVSDIPEIAGLIEKEKLGFVYRSKAELKSIFLQIVEMDNKQYQEVLASISNARSSFDLNSIYEKI